jgi:hypothetical protein
MPLVVATDSFLFSLATHLMVKNQKKFLLLVCFTEKVVTKADETGRKQTYVFQSFQDSTDKTRGR